MESISKPKHQLNQQKDTAMKTSRLPVIPEHAQYVRFKDIELMKLYDHEDIQTEFHADRALMWVANILASIGVFCALMLAIAVLMQVPDSWVSWLVLAIWGV